MMNDIETLLKQLDFEDGKIVIKKNFELYDALKKLIDLGQSQVEISQAYDEINSVLISYAEMDFTSVVVDTTAIQFLAPIQTALNMMAEELREKAAPKNFVDVCLEFIEYPAILTNAHGVIKHVNDNCLELLGFEIQHLLNTSISKLFYEDINLLGQEVLKEKDFLSIHSRIHLIKKNGDLTPVQLSIADSKGQSPFQYGLLYIAKVY